MEDKLTILTQSNEEVPIGHDYEYSIDQVFDMVHVAIAARPQVQCTLRHTFTKGLYCRELTMPAGTDIISKWHKTQHQFVVLEGSVEVFLRFNKEWILVEAPKHGITQAGTRRVLRTITKTVWLTFHPTERFPEDDSEQALLKAVEEVEEDIIYKRENPLLKTVNIGELQS